MVSELLDDWVVIHHILVIPVAETKPHPLTNLTSIGACVCIWVGCWVELRFTEVQLG